MSRRDRNLDCHPFEVSRPIVRHSSASAGTDICKVAHLATRKAWSTWQSEHPQDWTNKLAHPQKVPDRVLLLTLGEVGLGLYVGSDEEGEPQYLRKYERGMGKVVRHISKEAPTRMVLPAPTEVITHTDRATGERHLLLTVDHASQREVASLDEQRARLAAAFAEVTHRQAHEFFDDGFHPAIPLATFPAALSPGNSPDTPHVTQHEVGQIRLAVQDALDQSSFAGNLALGAIELVTK